LLDIKATRMAHGVAPVRKLPDGSDFYTLPIIHDPATDIYVGDSFDIAVYLDQAYPQSGLRLFPPDSIGVHRVFNAHVDALFTRYVGLSTERFPFNLETAEASKAEFLRRLPLGSWSDLVIKGEARLKIVEDFETDMEEFAKLYRYENGPFLEGEIISYADIIVGGWLAWLKETLPEWDQLCKWQGGRWKRLHEALDQWADLK